MEVKTKDEGQCSLLSWKERSLTTDSSSYDSGSIRQDVIHDSNLSSILRKYSSSTISDQQLEEKQNRVSFGVVSVRSHSITLGDNPSCSRGPPISLDWEIDQSETMDFEEYDSILREKNSTNWLPSDVNAVRRRHLLVLKAGVDEKDIFKAEEELLKIKKSRSITRRFSRFWRLQYILESANRKLKRFFRKKGLLRK